VAEQSSGAELDAWALTDAITRLRRVLRVAVRSDQPWETLPMAQVEILQRLRDEPGLRVRDLAERHRLAANTVSTLVQQLVESGLVIRDPDPDDRRAVVLSITSEGITALGQWSAAHERRIATALEGLPERERQRIARVVPTLLALAARLEADVSAEDPAGDTP
jgi:DNA-binding MarR family transcriptional regulator